MNGGEQSIGHVNGNRRGRAIVPHKWRISGVTWRLTPGDPVAVGVAQRNTDAARKQQGTRNPR